MKLTTEKTTVEMSSLEARLLLEELEKMRNVLSEHQRQPTSCAFDDYPVTDGLYSILLRNSENFNQNK